MARYDVVIVGMGSGGMVAAEFAASLDLRVAVVERGRVGGDCLWTGCVPSKALLASAKAAHTMRVADQWGLPSVVPEIDTALVWKRIRAVQQEVATTDDNPDRYRAMGIEIIAGSATLTGPHGVRVTAGDGSVSDLDTRFVLLCTGSRPSVPPIEGLVEAGYLTSENVFELERGPGSVVMIGGGPIAIEMAQGFSRLGIAVTVLQRGGRILPRDEPDLAATLTAMLRAEGVDLRLNVETRRVTVEDGRKVVHGAEDGVDARWDAEELMVAAGRRPNTEGLGLEKVGVEVGPKGVVVDQRMRTTVSSIYASGDLAGRFLFTHSAAYEGVRAVRDMFFPGKGTVTDFVPWCTFTDPELAHAGLTVAEARQRWGDGVDVWRMELAHSDRARAESASEGAIIIVTHDKKVMGAHILAPAAGEMIHELALAISRGMSFGDVAGLIHVYPTLSTSIGQLAAEAAFEGAKRLRWLVRREK
ncbi:MAG TPA: FAD-dependent oxidoreductase [Acidimicrobiales bacterium]|nr:FAD-dependent oxidoreductase [Acidimicrobiales bacterium]